VGPLRGDDLSADLHDECRGWFERADADRLRTFEEELGWPVEHRGILTRQTLEEG